MLTLGVETSAWSLLPAACNIPAGQERKSFVAALSGDRILVHGGINEAGSILGSVMEFNLGTRKWKLIESAGSAPSARYGHSGCLVNDTLVIYGGSDGARTLDDVWAFHLGTSLCSLSALLNYLPQGQ